MLYSKLLHQSIAIGALAWLPLSALPALAANTTALNDLTLSGVGLGLPVLAIPLHDPRDPNVDGDTVEGIHTLEQNLSATDEYQALNQIQTWAEVFRNPGAPDGENPLATGSGKVLFTFGNAYDDDDTAADDLPLDKSEWDASAPLGPVPGTLNDFFISKIYVYDFGNILTFEGLVQDRTTPGPHPDPDLTYFMKNDPGKVQGQNGIKDNADFCKEDPSMCQSDFDPGPDEAKWQFIRGSGGDKGIDVGERLGLLFSFNSDPAELAKSIDRIYFGFHAQSFDCESGCGSDSNSFWTTMPLNAGTSTEVVPEPGTLVLLATGLLGLLGYSRQRRA